jgi:hypothetical protein
VLNAQFLFSSVKEHFSLGEVDVSSMDGIHQNYTGLAINT